MKNQNDCRHNNTGGIEDFEDLQRGFEEVGTAKGVGIAEGAGTSEGVGRAEGVGTSKI